MTAKPLFVLISSFFLLLNFTIVAQTTVGTSGIAIQGIARNADNTAQTNTNITLNIKLYFIDGSTDVDIFNENNVTLSTDSYGVFSHVIDVNQTHFSKISNHQTFLRITEAGASTPISDEPLRQSPYAIAANNGVPTGSLMPYLDITPPPGWALCDGSALPTDGSADNLIAMIGNNAPDLRGMFLRGTGTSPVNGQDGPELMQTQNDTIQAHVHDAGQLVADANGNHKHTINGSIPGQSGTFLYDRIMTLGGDGTIKGDSVDGGADSTNEVNLQASIPMPERGNHIHTISGSTASTGDTETRPVSYGVVYIIKL